MSLKTTIQALCLLLLIAACKNEEPPSEPPPTPTPTGAHFLEESTQRSGDAQQGYTYLTEGDYVSSGIPFDIFKSTIGNASPLDLDRTGDNEGVAYNYSIITASNGVKVAAVNCLNCHAESLNGELIVGLGNNSDDYTNDPAQTFALVDFAVQLQYGMNSPEWAAYWPSSRSGKVIGPKIRTATVGPNPADKIFATLAAHRDKDDLSWLAQPQFVIPNEVVPTDVPAWWLMKKKHALYYNALGRGDFGRLSMASGLLTMKDSSEAREIDNKFADVMAYIRSIEAPVYPYPIDNVLAAEGKLLFEANCSTCHGTYGVEESYPNYYIEQKVVGTDPALAESYITNPEYHGWFNDSWFNTGSASATLEPTDGYIAPPLDGIWATAPYLHNASVPTLEGLLNSSTRPAIWKRDFSNTDYNEEKVGWNVITLAEKGTDIEVYDTNLLGYGNMGHIYGDSFTDTERKAVIEYLKTL